MAGAYIVVRTGGPRSSEYTPSFEFFLFVTITGMRGYHPVLAAEGGKPRVFKSFDRVLRMLRELGYNGPITIYDEHDPRRPAEATGATKRRPGDKAIETAIEGD